MTLHCISNVLGLFLHGPCFVVNYLLNILFSVIKPLGLTLLKWEGRLLIYWRMRGSQMKVKNYPCLYKKSDPTYEDKRAKHNAWKKVEEELGHEEGEAKKIFNNLKKKI